MTKLVLSLLFFLTMVTCSKNDSKKEINHNTTTNVPTSTVTPERKKEPEKQQPEKEPENFVVPEIFSHIRKGSSITVNNAQTLDSLLKLRDENDSYLLPETIYVAGEITNENGFSVEGVSGIKLIGKTSDAAITVTEGSSTVLYINAVAGMVVKGLSMHHNTETYCEAAVINVAESRDIEITECSLHGSGVYGVLIDSYSGPVIIRNNKLHHNSSDGVNTSSPLVIIENNSFYNNEISDICFDARYWSSHRVLSIKDNIFSKDGNGIVVRSDVDRDWKNPPESKTAYLTDSTLDLINRYETGSCYLTSDEEQTEYYLPQDYEEIGGEDQVENLVVDFFSKPECIDSLNTYDEADSRQLILYRTGIVRSGAYSGGILYNIVENTGMKTGYQDITVNRYIRYKNKLVYVSQSSNGEPLRPPFEYRNGDDENGEEMGFKDLPGFTLFTGVKKMINDAGIAIPELQPSDQLRIVPDQVDLSRVRSFIYTRNLPSYLKIVYYNQDLLPVYASFIDHSKEIGNDGSDNKYAGTCEDENCFELGGYYVLSPDGVMHVYTVPKEFFSPVFTSAPDDNTNQSDKGTDQSRENTKYLPYTTTDCSGTGVDFLCIVSQKDVNPDKELISEGSLMGGDPIYSLKLPEHPAYKTFYDELKNNWNKYYENYSDAEPLCSFKHFASSHPWFYWKDPIGRLVRVIQNTYLPPDNCEPMVYLYSEKPETVSVKLGKKIQPLNSLPRYTGGWLVRTGSDGKLIQISDNTVHNSLFWEGISGFLPRRKEGYVIQRDSITFFLEKKLYEFGLNHNESTDFIRAWKDKLSEGPYCFITFHNRDVIDSYAPLEITPLPQTMIRVLMDYEILDKPYNVSEPVFQSPPPRRGLTLVEWSGLRRDYLIAN